MIAGLASLLAAGSPRPLFYVWSAIVLAICLVGHLRIQRRYRQFVRETEAKLRRLEQRASEYEKRIDEQQETIDAAVARMQAELDAYGAWSDANDRFFHHGLVAVSHLIGARALPARRACATMREATQERRLAKTTWHPIANPAARHPQVAPLQRRTCR